MKILIISACGELCFPRKEANNFMAVQLSAFDSLVSSSSFYFVIRFTAPSVAQAVYSRMIERIMDWEGSGCGLCKRLSKYFSEGTEESREKCRDSLPSGRDFHRYPPSISRSYGPLPCRVFSVIFQKVSFLWAYIM